MRNLIILFLLFALSLPGANAHAARNVVSDAPKRVVVLDPGHGGPRPGKVLGDVVEKDYAGNIDYNNLGAVAMKFCGKAFDVEDDFGDVLFYTGDGGKFMTDTVNFYGRYSNAGKRGEQYASQAVAKSRTESTLERFNNEFSVAEVFGVFFGFDSRFFYF